VSFCGTPTPVHDAEIVLRFSATLLSGATILFKGFCAVLRRAPAIAEQKSEIKLRDDAALVG